MKIREFSPSEVFFTFTCPECKLKLTLHGQAKIKNVVCPGCENKNSREQNSSLQELMTALGVWQRFMEVSQGLKLELHLERGKRAEPLATDKPATPAPR